MNTSIVALASRPPVYELFFAPLEVAFRPDDLEAIQFAYFLSKYGHRGQLRDDGTRYFDHPKAAAWIYIHELNGRDLRIIIDLLLHDLREDAYLLSGYRAAKNFGMDIALDVRALTKLPKGKETTKEYLARIIERGAPAIIAKLCDRLHNLRTILTCSPEKIQRQMDETCQYHIPILLEALETCEDGTWSTVAYALRQKLENTLITTKKPPATLELGHSDRLRSV